MKKLIAYLLVFVMCAVAFVGCDKKGDDELTSAKDYLHAMYKDAAESTPTDYLRAGTVKVGENTYTVTWTVEVTSGSADDVKVVANEDGTYTIDVNEKAAADCVYTLTATISDAEGKTITDTYNYKVPAFKEFTWAEYMAAEVDDIVIVKGVITGIIAKSKGNSANGIYMQDNDGGYYIYGLAKDPVTEEGLEVGMTIRVSGAKDIYSGTHEVKDATVEILDSNKTEVTPVDFTEIYKNADDLKAEALVKQQAMLVTVKGVEITSQVESSGYYKFKLGELESYVRISSSVCPLNADEQAAFKAIHTDGTGYTADVTGVICVYDGAFYLTPVTSDAFSNLTLPERTDAEKVAFEKENLSIPANVTEDTVIELGLAGKTYDNVTFAWASDNACAVIDAEGKLTVTLPDEAVTVKLTLTATCGDVTETYEFEIAVDAKPKYTYTAEFVGPAQADTAYKFALVQGNLGKTLYFTGAMSGNYLDMSDNGDKAVDVYMEAVDGGIRIYFMEGETKKYIDVYEYTEGKVGVRITEEPTAVFVYNEAAKTYFANVAGGDYYLGTYKEYATISASSTSYITGDNAGNVGVTQFPAGFCTVTKTEGGEPPATEPPATEPPATEPPATEPSTDEGASLVTSVKDGGKYVIYYPDSSLAVTANADGKKLAGTEASVANNKLTVSADMAVFTVQYSGDYFYLIADGKYLTSGETGNSLAMADSASDLALWSLEEADGGFYIKNKAAAYNGKSQYLEFYYSFTTYGFNADKPNIYTFNFFEVK